MKAIDDSMLMAYLDGELDEATAGEVETIAANDPSLDSKIKDMRECDALLRSAFNHVMSGAGRPVVFPGFKGQQTEEEDKKPIASKPLPVALAASLALLFVGGISGFLMLDSLVEREFEHQVLLKNKDDQAMHQARNRALEKELSGTEVSWANPDNGNFGVILPVRTWRTETGRYCREFQESTTVGGTIFVEHGVACRSDDGSWKVRLRYFPE